MKAIVTFNSHSGASVWSSSEPLEGTAEEIVAFADTFREGRYPVITCKDAMDILLVRGAGYRGEAEAYQHRVESIGYRYGWQTVEERTASYLRMRGVCA